MREFIIKMTISFIFILIIIAYIKQCYPQIEIKISHEISQQYPNELRLRIND
jgi:hypothetical protein